MRIKLYSLSLLYFFIINGSVFAQTYHIGNSFQLPPHPRILLFKGEENTLKKNVSANSTWNDVQKAILNESDNLLTVAPIQRIQIGRRLLDKSREALRRMFFLAYSYRITGNMKYE